MLDVPDGVTVLVGDALDRLRELPDGSVDCIATSPPFFGLRDYQCEGQIGLEDTPDEWVARLVAVFAECRRVLADHGTFWLEVGDSYNAQQGKGWRPDASSGNPQPQSLVGGAVRDLRGGGIKPKDLLGQPWMLAFALRADGWWLRQCIIWAKPNAMPESARDRCTTAHSYVFLLSKRPRYWYDADAIAEPSDSDTGLTWEERKANGAPMRHGLDGAAAHKDGGFASGATRNARSVWTIPTRGYPGAHYATWPIALATRMIRAGCPREVCLVCGTPRKRLTEKEATGRVRDRAKAGLGVEASRESHGLDAVGGTFQEGIVYRTVGWSSCECADYRSGVVLDPFGGSGTTGVAAIREHRHAVLIELNEAYVTEQMIPRLRDWHKEPVRTRDGQIDGQLGLLEQL